MTQLLEDLYARIASRIHSKSSESYSAQLLEQGLAVIAQKCGEETTWYTQRLNNNARFGEPKSLRNSVSAYVCCRFP